LCAADPREAETKMSFQETNYWLTTADMPAGLPATGWPAHVDVALVGGGITGLSAARALARRGASVAVLETRNIGWGASSRNGGMVLTGLKVGVESLVANFGLERARRLYAASLASIDCVEQIVQEERILCDFARAGHLEVAYKPAHFGHFRRSAEYLDKDFGHMVRLVTRDELHTEIGSDLYHGGLVDDSSAGLNPARYVAGLARAAERAGASLWPETPVLQVTKDGAGYRVRASRGELAAGNVVIATSGYTGPATPRLRRRIVPIGSYIIATEVLPEDLARQVSPRNRMIFDSKNFLYYFRLTPDRRMLFGGRAGFFPETPHTIRESAAILRKAMLAVYPQLAGCRVEYAWGGTLDFAFDLMPHLGQMDGLWYALGYAGHGVAMATWMGSTMAQLLSDGAGADNPFEGLPFPRAPLGLYDGRPWFLPLAEVWYRLLDWIS
jgi:glycine/D-amino acid oxidase-like deaminating enzyme